MKLLVLLPALALAGCGLGAQPVRVETVTVIEEVQRPCPVVQPERPAGRVLPTNDLEALAATLSAWLLEFTAPGGYADKAEAAIAECTSPVAE